FWTAEHLALQHVYVDHRQRIFRRLVRAGPVVGFQPVVVVLQLVVRPLLAVSMLVIEADEGILVHAGIHVVTDFFAVDVAEYLVPEPAHGLSRATSPLGFAALGLSVLVLGLAICGKAVEALAKRLTGNAFWLFC